MANVAVQLPHAVGPRALAVAPPREPPIQENVLVKTGSDIWKERVGLVVKGALYWVAFTSGVYTTVFVLEVKIAAIIAGTATLPYAVLALGITALVLGFLIPTEYSTLMPFKPYRTNPSPILGLQNPGTDCFVIATLQLLLNSSQQVLRFLKDREVVTDSGRRTRTFNNIYRELLNAVTRQRNGTNRPAYTYAGSQTNAIRQALANLAVDCKDELRGNGQGDASELLESLLDGFHVNPGIVGTRTIHYNLNDENSGIPTPDSLALRRALETRDPEVIEEQMQEEHISPWSATTTSHDVETHGKIHLTIPDGPIQDIGWLLEQYFNFTHAPGAGHTRDVYRRMPNTRSATYQFHRIRATETTVTYNQPPSELFLSLGRFQNKEIRNSMIARMFGSPESRVEINAIHDPVDIPLEINLRGEWFNVPDDQFYRADGFVIHMGEYASGHYIAYVKKQKDDGSWQWFKMDDGTVTPVTEDDAQDAIRYAYIVHLTHQPVPAHP